MTTWQVVLAVFVGILFVGHLIEKATKGMSYEPRTVRFTPPEVVESTLDHEHVEVTPEEVTGTVNVAFDDFDEDEPETCAYCGRFFRPDSNGSCSNCGGAPA